MKRIKWENIICLIIGIISLIMYLVAAKNIEVIEDNYNSNRLFFVINIIFLIINTGNLLLWKCIRNIRR